MNLPYYQTFDGKPVLRYYLYEGSGGGFVQQCDELANNWYGIAVRRPQDADLAIAPYLTSKIEEDELHAPRLGVLIFHPSLLPRRRGPDAVRQAVAAGDPYTGATWFWADSGLDTGPIAEQELVSIPQGIKPRDLYQNRIIPAGLRAFRRVWEQLLLGYKREVPQDEAAATYESYLERPAPDVVIPSPS